MENSCHSKIRFLSTLRKIGPLAAFILMLTALLLLLYIMRHTYAALPDLITGKAFTLRFQYPSHAIRRWYVIATLFSAIAIPYTVFVRCFTHRKTRSAYWLFVVPTVTLYLYLLIIWTIPFNWLIEYTARGVTTKRIQGLFYGLGWYVVIMGFLWWAVRKPGKKNLQTKIEKIEEQNSVVLN